MRSRGPSRSRDAARLGAAPSQAAAPFMYVGSIDGGLRRLGAARRQAAREYRREARARRRHAARAGGARGGRGARGRTLREGDAHGARRGRSDDRPDRFRRRGRRRVGRGEPLSERPERAANMSALVLAARLSPAIAVPIARLLDALGPCVDGALTTRTEHLDEAFRLPSPSGAAHVDAAGQRPFFVFAGIPEGADAPESARDAPEGAPEPKRRRVAAAA